MEIKPRSYMISTIFMGGRQLHLFILRGDRMLLIDTGMAGMPKDLIFPYMQEHNLPLEELAFIASTHAHADHLGGNAEIQAACPGVKLGVHEIDKAWVENHMLSITELYERHAEMNAFSPEVRQWLIEVCGANSPVDIAWKGGEVIDLGGRSVEVVHAPGHTAGNVVFLDRQGGTLNEAETILEGATGQPGKLSVPGYFDVPAYRQTMRYLAELPWDLLASSHAMPRDRKAGLQAIKASLDFVDQFDGQLEATLKAQKGAVDFKTLAEAVAGRYGYNLDLGLILLLDPHLDHLRKTRRAVQLPDGRWAQA